jgi:tetratricopeptide (TPR) repeat protein
MYLRLASARTLVDAEKRRNPSNAVPILLDNYIDYFTVITSESKADFDRLKGNKSLRLGRLSKEDRNSPWYLFCQAEVNLQWALLHGLFQEYFNSSIAINRAFKLLKENAKKYPDFLPDQKGLGLVNAVLGSLPDGLKKTISILGVKGDTPRGVNMLDGLVRSLPSSAWPIFYDEAVFSMAYVKTDILVDPGAYPQIVSGARKMDTASLLKTYVLTYSAIRTGHTDDALEALRQRKTGREYAYFPKLDYLKGIARMHKLDPGAADDLLSFVQNYKGVNGTKDAYLNLAWNALLKGNPAGYQQNIELVKTKGYTLYDKDKQALSEAGDPAPDLNLLRARLLFDGGYYTEALNVLKDERTDAFKLLRDKIEYSYRLGRIYDELGRDDIAVKFYQGAITLGKNERYYFASNAALRAGNICEKKKDFAKARSFYTQALAMKDHDYEKSIETKAKDGLKRIE